MVFFSLKVKCDICGKDAGLNQFRIANKGWICAKCFKQCGFTATTPIMAMT